MPRIPLSWLGEHVELPVGLTADQLAADLVRVGLEEEAVHAAAVTGPLVVGRVVERTPEPQKNGKTINWCRVDVGDAHNERLEDGTRGPRGIVCGAHNFDVGDHVVVALPGAVLPGPFAIASRKTYGHVSDGMICSARELGLGEDHAGIIVLSEIGVDAPVGTDARELLGLGEEVLEINVTPDRGYCFSMRGVAREYAHATGAAFTDPALPEPTDVRPTGFAVELDDQAPIGGVPGVDRFVAQVVRGVAADAPSPTWMQRRLQQAGMRPISLAVDATNYVMLDLGQPLHAYDLARVAAPIVVRRAAAGETLRTLDDQVRTLDPQDLLVTDSPDGARGSRIIGLAGVMGGGDSEVGPATTDVLVEAAHWDPVTVARTARRHRIPSEAAKRYERGVDPRLPRVAVARIVALLVEHGGGTPDEALTDVDLSEPRTPFELDLDLPARLVGVAYTHDEVRDVLAEIGCTLADVRPGVVAVTPPSWRPDLAVPVDLVEEVARLRGYDAIPSIVPPAPAGPGLTFGQRARRAVADALAEHGLVEVLSYPFVGTDQLDALTLPPDDERRRAVRLLNPLSDAQPFMRTDLLVTLLDTARRNVARGNVDVCVFELGLVTLPTPGAGAAPALPGAVRPSPEDLDALRAAVPHQPRHVAGVLAGRLEPAGVWGDGRRADHGDAIDAVRRVAQVVGVDVRLVADQGRAPWHPGRCARVETAQGVVVGWAGELHPNVVAAHDLPARAAAFELDLDALLAAAPRDAFQARAVSTFPVAKEDVALVVPADVPAADVLAAVRAGAAASAAGDVVEDVRLFDVYEGDQVPAGHRSLAFALRLRAADRTLTAAETAAVRESVVAEAATRFSATLRA
ncbi:phenylalanine--tRNA ligase subunit beta [Cellulomonas gilvus]|uniref:Phenylalanine--tRNA ligase beta subunit n=1 Tax=Cellulomonas gilvus (strain ATCC 13127 / NRRL B-14078) TaxID=593907 RepID=F7ZZ46_CELGA|nr:phenylalanine--tRNA ligase subunit beta [Cellulomonas gilvus]AEI12462.1 phenylalanyl-tRNA synthetase, beta subunit [Cellulomonas gilvus ATCC 13127]